MSRLTPCDCRSDRLTADLADQSTKGFTPSVDKKCSLQATVKVCRRSSLEDEPRAHP